MSKLRVGQKVRCPRTERSSQPGADRHVESLFGALEETARQVAGEDLSQDPFALALAYLCGVWQCPGKLDDTMVEKRTTCFKAGRHAGTIEFHQYVTRQIFKHVANDEVGQSVVEWRHRRTRKGLSRCQLHFRKPRNPAIHLINVVGSEKLRETVQPVTLDHPAQPVWNREGVRNALPQATSEQRNADRCRLPKRPARTQQGGHAGDQKMSGIT